MRNRRDFLKDTFGATAGVVFVGCNIGHLHAAPQAGAAAGASSVTIGGRRVRAIDVHAHCIVPEAIEIAAKDPKFQGPIHAPDGAPLTAGPERAQAMARQRIDVEVLSINPFWYPMDRDLSDQIIRVQNEKMAELCQANPDRYKAFASVALQHPDMAVKQLEDAVTKLGMPGCCLGGSVNDEELSSQRFEPFWAKAEELGATVFIHPQGAPTLASRLKGNGMLANVIGYPVETTIALAHLIFDGVFDRYPKLKICAAHGGGFIGSYAPRFDHGCEVFPMNCMPNVPKKKPTEYLKQVYFDSLVFTSEALRHLVAEMGIGQIVLGTDHPYPWVADAVGHVLNTPGLSDTDKIAILSGNAERMLKTGGS